MPRAGVLALGFLLMVAAVPSNAQAPAEVSLTITQPGAPINHTSPTAVDATVNVGCAAIVAARGDGTITIEVADAPAWLTVTSEFADAAPSADCITSQGVVSVTGQIILTPGTDAPGLNFTTISVTAAVGDTPSEVAELTFEVDFKPGYTLTPDIQFPYTVTGDEVRFNVTIDVTANARSMVMVEEVTASAGSFSGLASQVYEVTEGPRVFPVVFTAPSGDWTESNVTFYAYNHYLLVTGGSGDPVLEMRPTWTFVNGDGGGNGGGDDEDGGDKGSPAFSPLLLLAAVALALVLRRRA